MIPLFLLAALIAKDHARLTEAAVEYRVGFLILCPKADWFRRRFHKKISIRVVS